MADPNPDKENAADEPAPAVRKEKCPDKEADFQGWLQFQKTQAREQ